MSRIRLALCSLLLVLIASACTEGGSSVNVNSSGDSTVIFAVPDFLNTRAFVSDNLDLFVSINGNEVTMSPLSNGQSTGSIRINKNLSVKLVVEWKEQLPDGTLMLLARATDSRITNIVEDITFVVDDDSYITAGEDAFDLDGDGINNLEELDRGLDPKSPNAPVNDVKPDVQIFATGAKTLIDGRQQPDDTFWDFATYVDDDRKKLTINNMIRNDLTGVIEQPSHDYQWAALHDEEFLTIFVWGKARNGTTIRANGDSTGPEEYFNDDSVEIFWDGDLSRGTQGYDTKDDMLINIPLVRGAPPYDEDNENKSSAADKRIYRGNSVRDEFVFDVQDSELVEFHTCLCGGAERSTWEIRINLEAANIPLGKTFGFEIQINRDDDGGLRDSKWAWARPALVPGQSPDDADSTWRYPVHMGKMRLVRFPTP